MRPAYIAFLSILAMSCFAPALFAQGCSILIYNLWATPPNGGYPNDHYDEDLIAILSTQGHVPVLVDRALQPSITDMLLADYDQLWIIAANNAQAVIAPSEVDAVARFRERGGGVALFGEHDDFFEDINMFAEPFRGRFEGTGVDHAVEIPTSTFPPHAIWQGVTSIGGALSEADVILLDPSFLMAIARHNDATMMAVHENGAGRVLLDASFVRLFDEEFSGTFQTWATEYDNEIYLANVAGWLRQCGPTAVEPGTWGRVKSIHR